MSKNVSVVVFICKEDQEPLSISDLFENCFCVRVKGKDGFLGSFSPQDSQGPLLDSVQGSLEILRHRSHSHNYLRALRQPILLKDIVLTRAVSENILGKPINVDSPMQRREKSRRSTCCPKNGDGGP